MSGPAIQTGSQPMSGSATLTIVSCPDQVCEPRTTERLSQTAVSSSKASCYVQDLAKTNMVFVAASDPLAQVGYIEVADV